MYLYTGCDSNFWFFLGMFEERALILGRMGRFEQAIGLYVHVLKADDEAEKYAAIEYFSSFEGLESKTD